MFEIIIVLIVVGGVLTAIHMVTQAVVRDAESARQHRRTTDGR